MYQNTGKFYGVFYNGAADAARRGNFIASQIDHHPARIIDVSAGVGDIAFYLAGLGHYVTCFEECDPMYAVLLDRYKEKKEIRHLVSLFPISINGFPVHLDADLAVASNVFSHLDKKEKQLLMHNVHAQLRAGGQFLFNCVQYTHFRPKQPLSEINKKVFGEMVVHHFASSIPVENSEGQRVRFEYRIEFQDKAVGTFSDEFVLHMDTPASMSEALEAVGFREIRVFGSYEGIPPDPSLPGFVIAATKPS